MDLQLFCCYPFNDKNKYHCFNIVIYKFVLVAIIEGTYFKTVSYETVYENRTRVCHVRVAVPDDVCDLGCDPLYQAT